MGVVDYRPEGSYAVLAMDDGKANVLSPQMLSELGAGLDRAEADGLAVVLLGRPGMFSGGFDLATLRGGGPASVDMLLGGFRLAERLLGFGAPVVAACTGHAIAMASFLLLSVDYRVGAAGTFKIGANETAIGLVMPAFGVEICRQRLTPAHFQRTVINAEIFTPQEAVAAGYLDRTAAPEDVEAEARQVAETLAALDRNTHTSTKRRAREQALKAVHDAIAADAVALGAAG
ncbi:MAG TPA: crotonase/enoyl-CoA hydratase family protein [Acidimicrobiales bacterium]|nr:crotonase/enoyl-CoA hydratase family protein [Acidimicrobiales bacterium]